MASVNRDIATILGRTEAANANNTALGSGGEGGSLTVYDSIGSLPSTSLTEGDQAFVSSTSRFYISNGAGWYNVALINAAPYWDSEPLSTYSIEDSATPLIITALARDSDNPASIITDQSFASDSAAFLVDITRDSSVFTFTPKSEDSIGASVTAGDLTDSGTNDFIYTFKWSDGINFVSKAVTINYNTGFAGSLLWRYFVVTPSNHSSNLWDLQPNGASSTGWYDGATQVTTGITGAFGTTLGAGKWGVFTSGANPLTDNTYNTWNAGPETGSLDYLVGGRTAVALDAGRFIAVRFSTEVSNISRIYHRTYAGARPDRIPNSARLEFYSGDVIQSHE